MKNIKIFLASPNDVIKERNIVKNIVDELNSTLAIYHDIHLDIFDWQKNLITGMGRPQSLVFEQSNPDTWNIFVGILWTRFGSKSGKQFDNHELTGTEEEFNEAYNIWNDSKKLEILFYQCLKKPSPEKIDSGQLLKVQEFFKQFYIDGKNPGFYRQFKSVKEFEFHIRKDLISKIYDYIKYNENFNSNNILQQNNILNIYTKINNDLRNKNKKEAIREAKEIKLLAHSGYSFLAYYGHKFRDLVINHLDSGKTFRAILTNPWSITGLILSLSESDENNIALKDINPIEVIKNTRWYKIKFKESIEGYRGLKAKYNDRIEIRLSKIEMPASILCLEKKCFYEAYLPISLDLRYRNLISTFELEVDNNCDLYTVSDAYFSFLWQNSKSVSKFLEEESSDIKDLSDYYKKFI